MKTTEPERLTGSVIVDEDGQIIDGDRARAALLDDDTIDEMTAELDEEEVTSE